MAELFTSERFEDCMGGLHEAITTANQEGDFDLAELLEEALLFMRPLRGTFPDAVPAEAAPLVGDMITLRNMAADMKQAQIKLEDCKAAQSEARQIFDDLRLKKVPEMMAACQVGTTVFPGIGRLQTASDLYASTKKGMKEEAKTWLRDCGYGEMIVETYNSSSLKALFRRMIKDGSFPPDEIFNVTPFTRASIVKA